MIQREREGGNVPQVDSLLIENAFRSSIAFLRSQGELREREGKAEVVARGHSGIEISVASPFRQEDLVTLSRVDGGRPGERLEDIILGSASRVRVSEGQTSTKDDELTLVKFDPGQLRYPPEDAWKMREILEDGVQYSVKGQGTSESLTEKISGLIRELSWTDI